MNLLKRRVTLEIENNSFGMEEIVGGLDQEETAQKECITEKIESILSEKVESEERIKENLVKIENNERLIEFRKRMKQIFKDPYIPEIFIFSSSSTSTPIESYESDDEDDSQPEVGNQNAKYGDENAESMIIDDAAKDDDAKDKDNNDDGDESDDEENSQVVRDVEEDERNKVSDDKDNNDDKGGSNMEGARKKLLRKRGVEIKMIRKREWKKEKVNKAQQDNQKKMVEQVKALEERAQKEEDDE
ncbi:hypothetical protein Tco_1076407 [Tanacetum coccineum]